ncbi:MAG: LysR family transcriptional regulator [Planctomycetota bacterium]|nr:LysR family transcriptional regulator [Planctomycetota bacterium]
MEWLNFRHLYAFWMVARSQGFTRAAEQMHVAQSAVSAQVASLENYLDEQLLVRANRTVELTQVGRELLGYANAIFAQSRAVNALIKDKSELGGPRFMRLGVVGGASRNFVFRLLQEYLQQAPGVRVSVSTGSYKELYSQLRHLELDAIITLDLPKKSDLSEVSYQKLGESEMCLVAVPELIAEIRQKSLVENIDVFKFRHPFEVDVLEKYVRPIVDCELTLVMDTDDIPLLRFFANSGEGAAVLPRVGVLEDLAAGVVEAIELTRCPSVIIYGITMRQSFAIPSANGPVALWPVSP